MAGGYPFKLLKSSGQFDKLGVSNTMALEADTQKLLEGARLSQESHERHKAQQHKRSKYFLKGPLLFEWICENIPDPASRVILVARAFMDMERRNDCVLSRKVLHCAGIEGKDLRGRTLNNIRQSVLGYVVINRPGRPCVLRRTGDG